MCDVPDPQQVFTLRGLCEESQIDRGYFLVNGRKGDANATLMNPVYEGYFSQLRFNSQSEEADESEGFEQERFMIPQGQWEISSRLPRSKYSYRVVQLNSTSECSFYSLCISLEQNIR